MSLSQSHSLPSPDLAYKLFEVYFRFIHPFFPIIHRQTFEAQYADGLHKRDPYHAQLVLSVCAVASIYSNDPLVCSTVAGRQVRGMRFIHDILHSGCALGNVNLSMLQAFVVGSQIIGSEHVLTSHAATNCLPSISRGDSYVLDYHRPWYKACSRHRCSSQVFSRYQEPSRS